MVAIYKFEIYTHIDMKKGLAISMFQLELLINDLNNLTIFYENLMNLILRDVKDVILLEREIMRYIFFCGVSETVAFKSESNILC